MGTEGAKVSNVSQRRLLFGTIVVLELFFAEHIAEIVLLRPITTTDPFLALGERALDIVGLAVLFYFLIIVGRDVHSFLLKSEKT